MNRERGVGVRAAKVRSSTELVSAHYIIPSDCLKLTRALQKTSETLQSVADLYDDHVRRIPTYLMS
jgi:hypothetical protein